MRATELDIFYRLHFSVDFIFYIYFVLWNWQLTFLSVYCSVYSNSVSIGLVLCILPTFALNVIDFNLCWFTVRILQLISAWSADSDYTAVECCAWLTSVYLSNEIQRTLFWAFAFSVSDIAPKSSCRVVISTFQIVAICFVWQLAVSWPCFSVFGRRTCLCGIRVWYASVARNGLPVVTTRQVHSVTWKNFQVGNCVCSFASAVAWMKYHRHGIDWQPYICSL